MSMARTLVRTGLDGPATLLAVRARPDFVETPSIRDLTERALAYLEAGFPVHFRGPAGSGKTTLALHVAGHLGRPVILVAGDEEFGTRDLVGSEFGYTFRKVVDRYIHSVLKTEEDMMRRWVDHRLTTACREGFTLVYDEFTRSRPEANNVLLSVLEERLLILPTMVGQEDYIKVHPRFRAVFTSNPREYAGVHQTQDALNDRLVTIDLDYYDRDTEIDITAAKSGLSRDMAAGIVDVVRHLRATGECSQMPTLRSCLMIAQVAARQKIVPRASDKRFQQICLDVLASKAAPLQGAEGGQAQPPQVLLDLIGRHCPDRRRRPARSRKESGQSPREGRGEGPT